MKWIWQSPNWQDFILEAEVLLPFLSKARLEQGKLLARMRELGFELGQEACVDILTEEAIKTSEIEGEHLNRDLVRSSVAKHLGLSSFGLPQASRSIDGLVDILIDATKRYDQSLTGPIVQLIEKHAPTAVILSKDVKISEDTARKDYI